MPRHPPSPATGAQLGRSAVIVALALLIVAATSTAAVADEYLEERFPRSGFALGLGVGPGFFLGTGDYDQLLGVGFAASLRFGTTTGPRSLLLAEIDSVTYLAEYVAEDTSKKTATNVHSTITLAVQYYVREVLWLKSGAGVATLARREEQDAKAENVSKGFAWMGSCGYEMFHRGSFTLDLEATVGVGIYRDGVIGQLGAALAANWY